MTRTEMDELFEASRARLDRAKVPDTKNDEVLVPDGDEPPLPLKPIERPAKGDGGDNRHQDPEIQSIIRARIDAVDVELKAEVEVIDVNVWGPTTAVDWERRKAAAGFSVSNAIDDEGTNKKLLQLALSQKSKNSAKFHIFETFQMLTLYRKQHKLAKELDKLSKEEAGHLRHDNDDGDDDDDESDYYDAEHYLKEYRKSLSSKIPHDRGTDRRLPSISRSITTFPLDQIPEAPLLPRQQATHCRHHQAPPRGLLSE
jgi:hypothetical protein